ncbi:alpha-hydroxy acid oxidase [Nocardioides sp.]|uniref:alpha-hydroxy acid oxidase n=1 Tax=Nocardioides sp. TaxID=35761 RepID=UPI003D1169A7
MDRWLNSLEETARQALAVPLFRYLSQGARDGTTASEAHAAWAEFRLLPHVLRDVTEIDTRTTVLGTELTCPVAVAPTTLQRAVHPDGELAMARATAATGSLVVVSSNAGTPFADIGATGADWWLQVYLSADRTLSEPLLASAVAAGAKALVLTVDTPVVGTKYDGAGPTVWETTDPAILRVNAEPDLSEAPGAEKATDLGPHDIGWLAETTGLPVVVKGVLRPDDARRCVQAGAAGIWVSNHGGRQLDRSVSTAAALAPVAEAVGSEAEVYVDGGVRSGLDVVTALSLGARAVFLGRLPLYALVGGESAVQRMLTDLQDELVDALRLSGCRHLGDTRGLAVRGPLTGL